MPRSSSGALTCSTRCRTPLRPAPRWRAPSATATRPWSSPRAGDRWPCSRWPTNCVPEPQPPSRRSAGRRAALPCCATGDAAAPAARAAAALTLDDVRPGLLPAQKAAAVTDWQSDGRRVLAVGDGINDAPLLATADVGLAVGEGAGALAVQAADGVLLRDPLGSLPPLLALRPPRPAGRAGQPRPRRVGDRRPR